MAAQESTMPFYIFIPWWIKSPGKLKESARLPKEVHEGRHPKNMPAFPSWKDVGGLGVLVITMIIPEPQIQGVEFITLPSSWHVFTVLSLVPALVSCVYSPFLSLADHSLQPPWVIVSACWVHSNLFACILTVETCIVNLHNSTVLYVFLFSLN